MSNRSRVAAVATAAALVPTLAVGSQTPAAAAPTVITVTKTTDGVNSHDGLTTLREAVAEANTAAGPVEIVLVAGAAHHLSSCGSGADSGDLNLTTGHAVTITGQGASIVQHCTDRVLQHDPPLAPSALTITGTTLRGGSSGSDEGTAIDSSGTLVLDDVTVRANGAGAAAVVLHRTGTGTIAHSSISDNAGSSGVVSWQGNLTITDSVVSNNWTDGGSWALAAGVHAEGDIVIERSTISDNRTAETPLPPRPHDDLLALYALDLTTAGGGVWSTDGAVTLTDAVVTDNGGSVVGGIYAPEVTATRSTVAGNLGGGSDVADAGGIWAGIVTIADSTIDGNASNFVGGGVRASTGTISDSLITANLGSTGAVHVENYVGQLVIERSTITGNRAPMGSGLMIEHGSVALEHTTVADNPQLIVYSPYEHRSQITIGNPNFDRQGLLTTRSSLLGSTAADTPDCLLGSPTSAIVSLGTNADGDGSCGLTDGTDRPAIGDPQLSPLADDGGTTRTMLPQPWSPLRDVVPPGTPGCDLGDVSQNGLTVPQGPGCEIGASERAAATGMSGIVTEFGSGAPLAGIEVRVRSATNVYVAATTTGADGGWYVPGLAAGDYKVLFRDPTSAHPPTFNDGTSTFGNAPPIHVAAHTVVDVDQAMVFTPAITGTITETGTGTALGGIQVRARTLANTFVGATTTAADGTYALHLPPGTYKLVFTDPTGTHRTEWYADKPGFAKATPVTHADATTIANTQLAPISD